MGNDVSRSSLEHAISYLRGTRNCDLLQMNAARLAFRDSRFDAVICIQDGITAFGVDQQTLVAEAVRVTRNGGRILFSSCSPRIWSSRLDWFRAQSRAGLVAELDEGQSREGAIVCRDGFRSATISGKEFRALFARIGQQTEVREIDESSVLAEVEKTRSR